MIILSRVFFTELLLETHKLYDYAEYCSILKYFVIHLITGKPAKLYDKANPDWAPTQKMGHEKLVLKVSDIDLSRHERAAERGKKRKQFEKEKAMQRAEKFARAEELATEEIRIAQRKYMPTWCHGPFHLFPTNIVNK